MGPLSPPRPAMAGQAEKKLAKKHEAHGAYYLYAILGVNVWYILYRVLWHFSTFTFWHICGFILFTLVSRVSYQFIQGALEEGGFSEYAFDCYCINLTTQALVPLTNWGWVIYLAIPGFILYKLGGMFHSYI